MRTRSVCRIAVRVTGRDRAAAGAAAIELSIQQRLGAADSCIDDTDFDILTMVRIPCRRNIHIRVISRLLAAGSDGGVVSSIQ